MDSDVGPSPYREKSVQVEVHDSLYDQDLAHGVI